MYAAFGCTLYIDGNLANQDYARDGDHHDVNCLRVLTPSLLAGWLVAGEPLIQNLGEYPSEIEALPVVQQWISYLRSGRTVREWKNQHGITRMDGMR